MNYKNKLRCQRGSIITEGTAALVLFLPILLAMLSVTWEGARMIWIKQCLDQGSQHAAKLLATDYPNEPEAQTNVAISNASAEVQKWYTDVRVSQVIANNAQFASTYNVGANNQTPSVTVTVTYMSGSFGLPKWPGFDPLGVGLHIPQPTSTSTYRLEGQPSN